MIVVDCALSDCGPITAILARVGNGNLTATLTPGDLNVYRDIRNGWYFTAFSLVMTLYAAYVSALAGSKLSIYVRVHGFEFSIAQVSLAIHFASNLYRAIYVALDPFYAGRYFTGPQAHAQVTVTWPVPIVTTMLVSLYLRELLEKLTLKGSLRISNFLTKMKWPFAIVSLTVIALEISNSTLRALRAANILTLLYATVSIYTAIAWLMSGFFVYTASRVLLHQIRASHLRNPNTAAVPATSSEKKRLRHIRKVAWIFKTFKYIIGAAGFLVLWSIAVILHAVAVRTDSYSKPFFASFLVLSC